MFIIISGCSGVGKNTIIKELLKKNNNMKMFKTCTTRKERQEEKGNNLYIHLTKEEFENKIKNGELFEFEEIHGNLYGTLNSSIDEIKTSKSHFIKDIGVCGQSAFKQKLPSDVKIVSIFLYAPKEELIRRLTERGETEIEKRMERYEFENSQVGNFDYVINNDNIQNTLMQIENIIANN